MADADTEASEEAPPDALDDGPVRCDYCERQFATPRLCALHCGQTHTDEVDADEWGRVVAAREAEAAELRRFRLRLLLALVGLYFGFLLVYALH